MQKAVQIMLVVPKTANDMMNVGRLQGFEVNIVHEKHAALLSSIYLDVDGF